MTKEQAYALVQQRVMELQDAVMQLATVHVDGNVGLQEWCDSMDDVMYEISNEVFDTEE